MLDTIYNDITTLLNQDPPPLAELRKALLEVEELLSSAEYEGLDSQDRTRLQELRREVKNRLRREEIQEGATAPLADEAVRDIPITGARPPAKPRNPLADQQMEDAEKLFYSGRYAEAIKLFDRVLQMEPSWERARQHRSESENYLRTGYIPPVALPAEAASSFGKAQSAARVGRYADALAMLAKAQNTLRDLGIARWQEGLEFEQKLQESVDAELIFNEGMQLFESGKVDEAIERIETAARTTGLPKYSDRAQVLRRVKEMTRTINESLSAPNVDPKMVTQAKSDLDLLFAEHGENPTLVRLRSRLESVIPRAIEPLQEQARALKAQAERSTSLDEAGYLARQAKTHLDQIRNLAGLDESLDHLQAEVDRLIGDVARLTDETAQAAASAANHRRWPIAADRLLQEARRRYPNDPSVIDVYRSLSGYRMTRTLIRLGILMLIIFILTLLALSGYRRFQSYLLSLTPTPTPTFTPTPTYTPTFTLTSTPTLTPTPTLTFTPTPPPTSGFALRDIWARGGCYEDYNAIGRIPTGAEVRFLPQDRRFDNFNRECVLVAAEGDRSVIGWVLIMDLSALPIVTPTP